MADPDEFSTRPTSPMPRDTTTQLVTLADRGFVDAAAEHLAGVTALAARARTAMIHLRTGDELRLVGAAFPPPGRERMRSVPASRTLAGWIVAHGHPLIIGDLSTDPRVPPDAPARELGVRCYAGFPIRDADTEIVGTCAVMDYRPREWDVTALSGVAAGAETCTAIAAEHRARAEVDRHRRFLDALLESLHSGVLAVDSGGRLMFTNTAMRALHAGLPAGEDLATWAQDHGSMSDWFGGDAPASALPLLKALTGEDVGETEIALVEESGHHRHLVADAEPIADPTGDRLGAVLVARDVTVQRRLERYARAEAAISAVLADSPSVDEAAPRLLETLCRTLGWAYAEFWLVQSGAEVLVPTAQHSPAGRRLRVPAVLRRGDGLAGTAWTADAPFWHHLDDSALISGETAGDSGLRTGLAVPIPIRGHTQAVICLFSDRVLTEPGNLGSRSAALSAHIGQYLHRRRAEEAELALARTKDEYLALIGHEMRTPLTTIVSYTELALDDPDPDPATTRRLLEVVDRNAARLRRIIDELIDMAALDAREGVHLDQTVDLTVLAAAAADGVRPRATAAGLTLRTDLAEGCAVVGDGDRLRQVLDHLLENAVHHGPAGGALTVTLARSPDGEVVLTITDTGAGIPVDEQDRVFARFYRTIRSREQQIPGAGLGLAISRAIVELHGGTLTLAQHPAPPTELVIRLPATPDHRSGAGQRSAAAPE